MTCIFDLKFMAAAIRLSHRHLGLTGKNPSVGALIVKYDNTGVGRIVGHGVTGIGGRPHAESQALKMAGAMAYGSTAYITLEPCAHYGATPPCSLALIKAGVKRVVVALKDPDVRVAGRGIAQLQEAGIEVKIGVLPKSAYEVLSSYFMMHYHKRAELTLKMALSLEKAIGQVGHGKVDISNAVSAGQTHILRSQSNAIMIGVETAIADDPQLTCRLAGLGNRSPTRVILDPRLRLPAETQLVQTAHKVPSWIFCAQPYYNARKAQLLRGYGVRIFALEGNTLSLSPAQILSLLYTQKIYRVLLEGGATTAQHFLQAGLVDRLVLINTPKKLKGALIAAPDFPAYTEAYQEITTRYLGQDCWREWRQNYVYGHHNRYWFD